MKSVALGEISEMYDSSYSFPVRIIFSYFRDNFFLQRADQPFYYLVQQQSPEVQHELKQ